MLKFDSFLHQSLVFVIIGWIHVISGQNLILKACCNGDGNCAEYKQPEEMFGVTCCGSNPMNQFDEICCDSIKRNRRQGAVYIDRCCGNQTLAYDQTCCQKVVHNLPNGECCGSQAYARSNTNALCCDNVLNLNVPKGSICCGTNPYDGGIRETCCGGSIHRKELFDSCCPSIDAEINETTYIPYHSKVSLCCDKPIEKLGTTKCCYLKTPKGKFVPHSYDYTTSCCAYPYTDITPKVNGTCIYSRETVSSASYHNNIRTNNIF